MSDCGLALYEGEKWGFKRPRAWMYKHGSYCVHNAVDAEEFREYIAMCKSIKKIMPRRSSKAYVPSDAERYFLRVPI